MKNIKKSIGEWMKKYDKNVAFIGSFIAFNQEGAVKDDLIIGYGDKEVLKISMREMTKILKGDKNKFINW